jgi:O-antigen ligase
LARLHIFFYFFPVLFGFCLPFGGYVLSYIIVAWLLFSLFAINKTKWLSGLKQLPFVFSVLFFVVTVISAIWKGGPERWSSIEIKLSFIIFPYLFYCFNYPVSIVKRMLVAFVSGNFFAGLLLLIRGTYYALQNQPEYLTYSGFSNFIHTAYFALYLTLAGIIIVVYYPAWFKSNPQLLKFSWFMLAFFMICIFLCASKIGILGMFVAFIALSLHKMKSMLTIKKVLVLIGGVFVALFFLVQLFPAIYYRFDNLLHLDISHLNKSSSESSEVRLLIWNECLAILKSNFIGGVGVGNANQTLYDFYKINGLIGALDHKLNAHNQFFQTAIGLGLFGLLPLSLLFFKGWQKTIKTNFILFLLTSLLFLNFLTESMLQAAAGVLFFSFFTNLFFNYNYESLTKQGS